MTIRRRDGNVIITLPELKEPKPSKSRKSVVVATSYGVRRSKLRVDDQRILYVASAFYYPVRRPARRRFTRRQKKARR